MTLKEELEILRGEPIKVFDGDPMDIPCIETSDSVMLCKHPVVSVNMITYNHEPYIRQAIEGVMMQKTDFEFELIIGEDCSQDKTREICFEYQKRYPDKIRVLWWHENVSKLGGNSRRVRARCRGEFIALCEGDDYWLDTFKLQKQVDAFRANPSLAIAMTGGKLLQGTNLKHCTWFDGFHKDGLIKGSEFFRSHLDGKTTFMLTASAMLRKEMFTSANKKYEIFRFCLTLGDTTRWLAMASVGDFWWESSDTVVYRRHLGGITQGKSRLLVGIDAALVRLYYDNYVLGVPFWRSKFAYDVLDCRLRFKSQMPFVWRIKELARIVSAFYRYLWFYHFASIIGICLFLFGKDRFGPISGRAIIGFTKKLHHIPHCLLYWIRGR